MQNTEERVEIAAYSERGRPIDPKKITLSVCDASGCPYFTEVFHPTGPNPVPSRIQRADKGLYYFPFGADNANGFPATLYGKNAPPAPWDISVNNQLRLALDSRAFIVVTLASSTPTQATPADVINSINKALADSPTYGCNYSQVARFFNGVLFLVSPMRYNPQKSSVQVDITVANNASPAIFGYLPTTGIYSVTYQQCAGDVNVQLVQSNRTQSTGDFLFHWQVVCGPNMGSQSIIQVVKIASPRALSILPYFRTELDKALKQVGNDRARTGYTDSQLMGYLTLAVTEINAYQPITNMTIDNFPSDSFKMILIWTALLVALISQGLFAVDTDINYSDRGASFQIDHTSKIQSFITTIINRLEQRMQSFKLQYAPVGLVKIEAGASARLAEILSAGPSGTLFRGLFSGGPNSMSNLQF